MFRRILWSGVAGALLLLGVIGYGVLVYPQQQARAAVAAAFAGLPAGWSGRYGALDYALVARRIVIGDLVLARGDTRIAIARLVLTGVDGDARKGSLLHASEAALDGFSLSAAGGATLSVARATATAFAVDLASLAEALGRDDAALALLVLPRFVSASTLTATSYRWNDNDKIDEIAEISAEAIGHGAIGTLLLSDCRSSGDLNGRVGTIRFTGLATDLFLDAPSNSPAEVGTARAPLIGRVEWHGLALSTLDMRFQFDVLELDGLRRSAAAPAPAPKDASSGTLLAWLAASFAADRFSLLAARIEASGANLAGLAVQRLDLSAYDGGALAAGEAAGIELTTTASLPLQTAVVSLRLRDADASRWLRLRSDASSADGAGDGVFTRIGAVDITAFRSDTAAGRSLRVASFHSELTDESGRATAKIVIEGAELPVDGGFLPRDQAAMIRPLGLKTLGLDLAVATRWERSERRLEIESLQLGMAGLGEMTLAGALANFDGDCFDVVTFLAALQRAAVDRLVIHYRDTSLVERLLATSAKQAGVSEDQLRGALIAQANAQAKELAQPDAARALRQLALFLKNPQDVTVTMTPPHPLGLAQIMATPALELPKLLGLRVAVGQRLP